MPNLPGMVALKSIFVEVIRFTRRSGLENLTICKKNKVSNLSKYTAEDIHCSSNVLHMKITLIFLSL